MPEAIQAYDSIIIGAGLSGLVAARRLQATGWRVLVLDKGRGVGGRLATRRVTDAADGSTGVFDHGAQFFTARDEQFVNLVSEWQSAGLVREWCRGFADASSESSHNGHARYAAVNGMAALAKHLALGLNVRTNELATSLKHDEQNRVWQVGTEGGDQLTARSLVLTPPVPQSLALVATSETPLPSAARAALEAITYHPCLAALALLAGPSRIPAPGGMQLNAGPLSWIADNHQKGVSPRLGAVTIHAAPAFSREHYGASDEDVARLLLEAAAEWLGARASSVQVKRWRYSRPATTHSAPCVLIEGRPPLVFAGDAFAGPRVEGAALSGLAAADALLIGAGTEKAARES